MGDAPMTIDGKDIPRRDSARYLGIFWDKKLNYKEHVKMKHNEFNHFNLLLRQFAYIGYLEVTHLSVWPTNV